MRRWMASLFLIVTLLLGACAPAEQDPLALCKGALTAELEGELNGVAFGASLTLAPRNAEGVREATLTFYAPDSLNGTTVQRDAEGALSMTCNGLRLSSAGVNGFLPLLDLFPDGGTVSEIALEGELSRITGDGFVLLLHPDGTPAACRNSAADVRIVGFSTG